MICAGCDNPTGGLYIAGCRTCALRSIAQGPEFFASMRAGKLTPAYAALLCAHGQVSEVHAEVKAIAKTTIIGSIPA